jgi:glucosyl-3-phosphoglycerate synthase
MSGGFLDDAVQRWFNERTFGPSSFAAEELVEVKKDKGLRVTACLPARNEAETIGAICRSIGDDLMGGAQPLIDELLVIDSNSEDGTARVAADSGATVVHVTDLVPDVPLEPGGGKGDALWRSLSVATGDIVVWLDADTVNFGPHFVVQLIGPLLTDDSVMLCKAFYERPLVAGSTTVSSGGARVTELVVRPLLALFAPELAGIVQPLSGECAVRRDAAVQLPFFTGYAVEACLLVDTVERFGLDAIAQADLGTRVHRNRDIHALGRMSFEIMSALFHRLEDLGRFKLADELPSRLSQFIDPGEQLRVVSTEIEVVERSPIEKLLGR